MGDVFANSREIAAKKQDNKVIAAFPDVCMTPPENPATPPGIPVPYPSFAQDSDTENGTGTAKIGDENITHKNKSDYSKSTGTEAGAAAKKGVVSSANTGKEYASSWSGDVKADGQPVTRNADIATMNHTAEKPPNIVSVQVGGVGPGNGSAPKTKCPCCDAEPAHANQLKADGTMCEEVKEADYYAGKKGLADAKIRSPEAKSVPKGDPRRSKIAAQYRRRKQAHETIKKARASGSKCPNLHEEDKKCGIHFKDVPPMSEILERNNPAKAREIEAKHAGKERASRLINREKGNFVREKILGFDDKVRDDVLDRDGRPPPKENSKVHHKTPLTAGGCPSSLTNLIGQGALDPECDKLNKAQDELQNIGNPES